MRSCYRHREDVAPSLVVLSVLIIQMGAFFLLPDLGMVACVMLALLAFSAMPGSISHNHHHSATFRFAWMNRCYEVVLFLQTGVPPYAWTIHHNLGHHRYYLDPEEDTAPWQDKSGRMMSRIRYDVRGALMIFPEIYRVGRQHPLLLRRFNRWLLVSLAVLGVFLWLDPVRALVLFVLPMPIMYLGLLDNTYQQHSGLDMDSHLTASRNTTSRLYNFISWNLGYHTAHHLYPSVHWSRLPQLHETLRPEIPEGLVCHSVLLSDCPGLEPGEPAVDVTVLLPRPVRPPHTTTV